MNTTTKMKPCPDCDGDGERYEDTSRQCATPRSECCGGCGYYYECETCNGTGEVEDEGETEEKQLTMPTLTQLQTALADTPFLSIEARLTARQVIKKLTQNDTDHLECDKTTLGELARALQVETYWNGRTYSLTIENGVNRVILQTPVIINAK